MFWEKTVSRGLPEAVRGVLTQISRAVSRSVWWWLAGVLIILGIYAALVLVYAVAVTLR